jgi:hypothetical protein
MAFNSDRQTAVGDPKIDRLSDRCPASAPLRAGFITQILRNLGRLTASSYQEGRGHVAIELLVVTFSAPQPGRSDAVDKSGWSQIWPSLL